MEISLNYERGFLDLIFKMSLTEEINRQNLYYNEKKKKSVNKTCFILTVRKNMYFTIC